MDALASCAIGDVFALDPVARFLGPTAGAVVVRATGDITIVPEPTTGSLIAVTAAAGLVVRRLRRPGRGPLSPAR